MFNKKDRTPQDSTKDPHYQYWVRAIGKTVRITKGALAGTVGRLGGTNYRSGLVVFRTEDRCHTSIKDVWVSYADLVVDYCTRCCWHYDCHCC